MEKINMDRIKKSAMSAIKAVLFTVFLFLIVFLVVGCCAFFVNVVVRVKPTVFQIISFFVLFFVVEVATWFCISDRAKKEHKDKKEDEQ